MFVPASLISSLFHPSPPISLRRCSPFHMPGPVGPWRYRQRGAEKFGSVWKKTLFPLHFTRASEMRQTQLQTCAAPLRAPQRVEQITPQRPEEEPAKSSSSTLLSNAEHNVACPPLACHMCVSNALPTQCVYKYMYTFYRIFRLSNESA